MTEIAKDFAACLATLVLVYLAIAFIRLSLDPFTWGEGYRGSVIFVTMMLSPFAVMYRRWQ